MSLLDSRQVGREGVPDALPAGSLVQKPTTILLLAAAIGFGMSTQFLAQLFVWRNWPIGEVFEGWLYVLRDRLLVAFAIAAAIIIFGVARTRSVRGRTLLVAVSVPTGAAAGEWLLRMLDGGGESIGLWITHALRWSVVALAAAGTYYLWRRSVDIKEQLRREDLRHQSVTQQLINTRLTALRKQIEPHFLFNTLATVRRLHQTDPANGSIMLANFIDYLARLLPMLERSEVQLGEEADLVSAYLSVVQIRMSERLQVNVEVPAALRRACIPPLAVATLVENAVKHGLSPLQVGGCLDVTAVVKGAMLEVAVCDNGVGLNCEAGGGTGIGLYNVRTRLTTLYGPLASLQVQANPQAGVRASILVPLRLDST